MLGRGGVRLSNPDACWLKPYWWVLITDRSNPQKRQAGRLQITPSRPVVSQNKTFSACFLMGLESYLDTIMTAVIAHFHHFYWSFQILFYAVLCVNTYKDIPYLQLAANTNKPLPQHQVCFISLFPLLMLKTAVDLSSLDRNYRISEGFGPIKWHSIHWLGFSPRPCEDKERICELIQLLQ